MDKEIKNIKRRIKIIKIIKTKNFRGITTKKLTN